MKAGGRAMGRAGGWAGVRAGGPAAASSPGASGSGGGDSKCIVLEASAGVWSSLTWPYFPLGK